MGLRCLGLLAVLVVVAVTEKEFQLRIVNTLKEPNFDESVTLKIKHKTDTLYQYMMQATEDYPAQFTGYNLTTYEPYGYFVDAINGVAGTYNVDGSYWSIWNHEAYLTLGISSYVPVDGDAIRFELITAAGRR